MGRRNQRWGWGRAEAAALACLLLACDTPPPRPPPPPAPLIPMQVVEVLSAGLEQERKARGMVGLGVGVVLEGQVAFLGGFGHADLENRVPFDARKTRVRWASVSKTLTGVLAAKLWQQGRLDLDADLRAYLDYYDGPGGVVGPDGEVLPLAETVTITPRRVLHHLAGFQDYDNGVIPKGAPEPVPTPRELRDPKLNSGFEWALQRWIGNPLVRMPGTEFGYTTLGYNLAGAVLGAAWNKAVGKQQQADAGYYDAMAELLAGTPAAGIAPDREHAPLPDRAEGYRLLEDGTVRRIRAEDVAWKAPGGGMISTTEELAAWCALLAGERLLSAEAKEVAWKPGLLIDGDTPSDYGLGFALARHEGRRRVEHNGGQPKATTRLVLYPDEGLCIVAMTNTESASQRWPLDLTSLTDSVESLLLRAGVLE